ncbi:gluconokinase [Allonocardiopsis opalescens]|uniref:Gluconokinase n=1 Tax=Allonocardiopsis opalescens TaxID=1144618 RepID=A0A2T0PYG0_9ACTN|nr:gluconokinase [Allonocardiopsis opalescens]PRX96542.1 gluconokinase [Allonocardiopsis opalescens]
MSAPGPAIVVMGVSGAGKTSVGERLAAALGGGFVDADDLHPAENIRKMSAGIPLDDADRRPWLDRVAAKLRERSASGATTVIACSALRRGYRDRIRRGAGVPVFFVHLDGTEETIAERLSGRAGHFMPMSLLVTQLRTLEALEPDEAGITVDIRGTVEAIVASAIDGGPVPTGQVR